MLMEYFITEKPKFIIMMLYIEFLTIQYSIIPDLKTTMINNIIVGLILTGVYICIMKKRKYME